MSGATLATKDAVDPLIHKAYLDELADAYAPAPLDRTDPLISPLFADLRGFPPTLIQVGSAETLLDDATRLRRRHGRGRRRGDARNLAAHDPRLAALERAARGRAQGAGAGRGVHAALTMQRALPLPHGRRCRPR